ncbi:NAD(P)/FAD-dependent oxidoreductase [Hydrogenophaga sp.]|uniref:NAD(P)/FAD-dependent oxidoreductase n=1 Tax=Hydrogenophaga sp. TaxID=1904254 RepID=UPI003569B820
MLNDAADVIVVGGSYAGLSAALQLARARQRVVVVDAGQRRNRFARTSHGFLGQDGRAAAGIAQDARTQLLAYPNVQWLAGTAVAAQAQEEGFVLTTAEQTLRAQRLVLALGVVDELPAIEGLAERWGQSVFHCPYCHGYELNQGRIGVLASGEMSLHHAMLLPDWGRVTLFLNRSFVPDAAQLAALAGRGVVLEETPVVALVDQATLLLADGRQVVQDGLFTLTRTRLGSALPEQLGCALEQGPTGSYIRIGATMETTVAGVFACGDAARAFGNVAISVGDGALAGASAHRSLIFS